jgi:hypothetical protein
VEVADDVEHLLGQLEYYRRNGLPLTGEFLERLSLLEHRLEAL